MTYQYLTIRIIKKINQRVNDAKRQPSVLQAPNGLSVIVEQPQLTLFGQPAYPTIWLKAAYIFQKLAKKHLFVDGNKRTALESMVVFLYLNGYQFDMPDDLTIDWVVNMTKEPDNETVMQTIAQTIQKYSQKLPNEVV